MVLPIKFFFGTIKLRRVPDFYGQRKGFSRIKYLRKKTVCFDFRLSLIIKLSFIYFNSLLQTKQCFTPIFEYRRSSVVVNKSENFFLNKINRSKKKIITQV